MTRRAPEDVELALRLLGHDNADGRSALDRATADGRVHALLAERLTPLIGAAGAQALLQRSVKLTRAEYPCFEGVVVALERGDPPSTAIMELAEGLSKLEPKAASEASAALLATVLGLLKSLIGERLVLQILRSTFRAIEARGGEETEE